MAYQYAHAEAYGREAGKGKVGGNTIASVAAEAERLPGNCPHIAEPQPPTILHGVSPTEAAAAATRWAEQAKDARGHAYRKDGLCMLGGVITLPAAMADRWPAFRADAVKWLKKEYGDRLQSVVQHLDEAHPHVHFYVVPRVGERFTAIHDGLKAAEAADPNRGNRKRGAADKTLGRKSARLAYVEAMRKWQDRVYSFTKRYGLARIGPGRRRLSRGEYRAENRERERLAAREAALETGTADLSRAVKQERAFLDQQQAEARELQAVAEATRQWIEKNQTKVTVALTEILKGVPQEGVNRAWAAMKAIADAERSITPTPSKELHSRKDSDLER